MTLLPGLAVKVALNVVLEHDLGELLPPIVGLEVAKHEEAPEGEAGPVRTAVNPAAGGECIRERLAVAADQILGGTAKMKKTWMYTVCCLSGHGQPFVDIEITIAL